MTRYVYLEPDRERLAEVGPDFQQIGCSIVRNMSELEAHLPRYPETLLVIIGATVDLDEALMFSAYQRLQRPLIGVVLVRRSVDQADVLRCLRAGVREVVEETDWKGLREATTRSVDISKALSTSLRSGADQAPYGRVVTIFAGKGGCSRTFVAVNLAVALSAGGSRRVLLVDLDLQFGDVAIMLKLNPERSIAGGIAMAGRLDEPGLRSVVTQFRPGIDALLAPANPAQSEHVRRELVVEILDVARPLYDFIVIDTPALVTDQVLAALDMSDWLVPIVTRRPADAEDRAPDGRDIRHAGPARPGDPRPDHLRGRPDHPDQPVQGRQPPGRQHHRGGGHGGRHRHPPGPFVYEMGEGVGPRQMAGLKTTGVRPRFSDALGTYGVTLPATLFTGGAR